jgi:hypothetical protein
VLPSGECTYIVLNWVIRPHLLGGKLFFDECLIETVSTCMLAFYFEKHMRNNGRKLWRSSGVNAINLYHYYNTTFSSRHSVFRSGAAVWRMHLHRLELNDSTAFTSGQIILRHILNRNSTKCILGIFFRKAHAKPRENTIKFVRYVSNSFITLL